jgi:hypothetical protein
MERSDHVDDAGPAGWYRRKWINVWDDDEMQFWQRRLGISRETLITAVEAVGGEPMAVRRWVRGNRGR